MVLVALEGFGTRDFGHIGVARHAQCEHQLLGPHGDGPAFAF